MFEMYDDNKDGVLETITAGKMLMDLYRAMNKEFPPQLILLRISASSIVTIRERSPLRTWNALQSSITATKSDLSIITTNKFAIDDCSTVLGVDGVWIFELENEKSDVLMRLEVICSRV